MNSTPRQQGTGLARKPSGNPARPGLGPAPCTGPAPCARPALGLTLCAALALCLAFLAATAQAQGVIDKKRIIYVNSYHHGYEWSDQILDGLRERLAQSGVPFDLLIEYMDTKRFPDPQSEKSLFDFYAMKYKGGSVDAVVVSDDYAYQFMLKHQQELFPGVPVVFSGVNDFDPAQLEGRPDFTGVVEYPDFLANFKIAQSLAPKLRRFVVVGDDSLTGRAIQKQIRQSVAPLEGTVAIEYWVVKTLPELLERSASLTAQDAVFMIPIYLGSGTQVYSAYEVLGILAGNIPSQVYSGWQFLLGNGMVGGKLHSGQSEGRIAADLALRVAAGESPASIKVVSTFNDPDIFDYVVLKRFGIANSRLPKDATLINEPLNFYTINKQLFWVVVVIFFLLLYIVVLMVVSSLQKRSVEMQLKNQLSFLRILMDTIPLPLSHRGRDGRFLGCNLAFEQWFGVERDDLLKNPDHPLARGLTDVERQLLDTPGVRSFETDMQDAKGRTRGVIVSKASYLNAKGEIAGVVEAVQDITLRREAEEALRRSQSMLQTVLNNIPQLVYWLDTNLCVMGVNRPFQDFFHHQGAGEDQVQRLDEFLPPVEARITGAINSRVLQTGQPEHRRKMDLLLPGRELVRLEMNVVPLHDHTGRVVGVLGTAEDVTARVNLERQLLQSQKMEAIGALAGGIAHDFNNILTSIINSTELALMDIPPESEAASDLERTLRAARRGSRLVKQILAFSRPSQAGFQPVDVAEVVHEALGIFSATLPRNISLTENVSVSPAMVFADATQLHQIIMNLCANSYQALREAGGQLSIELTQVELDESQAELVPLPKGGYLRLCVSDNGPGIAPEIIDRIFDPFFTTKAKGEGTGLGLAVVHGIVKAHEGAMLVDSQPGVRTSFEMYLPRYDAPAPAAAHHPVPVRRGSEHILFVEDDEDQLRVVPRALAVYGYTVTAKSGADQALDYLTKTHGEHKVELVVTDYDMPGLSGVEFAERLLPLAPELPVIVVSGRRSALTAAGHLGNIKHVLLKPYNGDDLARAIGQVLKGGEA